MRPKTNHLLKIEWALAGVMTVDAKSGAPLDPSATPYELIKNGCDVGLDMNTRVPFR